MAQENTHHIVLTSRLIGKMATPSAQTGDSIERDVYLNNTLDKKQFWSNEPLNGGTAVVLTERKAGEEYKNAAGETKQVAKDGYNFVGKIGDAAAVRGINATKEAMQELGAL